MVTPWLQLINGPLPYSRGDSEYNLDVNVDTILDVFWKCSEWVKARCRLFCPLHSAQRKGQGGEREWGKKNAAEGASARGRQKPLAFHNGITLSH